MKIFQVIGCFILLNSQLIGSTQLAQKKSNHETPYTRERTQMLWAVDKAWEQAPSAGSSSFTNSLNKEEEFSESENLIAKLHSWILTELHFEDMPITAAIEFLIQKSKELDPQKKGINIFLKLPLSDQNSSQTRQAAQETNKEQTNDSTSEEPLINLQLKEIPFDIALHYVAKQANLRITADAHVISLLPLSEATETFITKQYQIPVNFFPNKEAPHDASLIAATTNSETRLPVRYNAQEYFFSQGIEFPEGSCANYSPSCNRLIVRNTPSNIDLIDSLVKAACRVIPSQVSIETKFIEINQDDLDQLSFNWLLAPFQLGDSGVYTSGGDFNESKRSSYPLSKAPMNPIGGLRSGDTAISQNSIDSVLANGLQNSAGTSKPAPGTFSIAGIYSNPQFQVIIRALHQQKGIDLMAAPHVTTKSGVTAVVKIIDELTYPTHYTPPQIPQSTTNNAGGLFYQTPPTITPSFPSSWATKNLGVTLEAKPTIAPDGCTIDLELHPQITDFDGFINYGTPINTVGYNAALTNMSAVPFSETLTTNTINQPVFSIREVTTSVTVTDGQTIILGGLIREDIQKFHDKIPFLGDIPLAGRLFQSRGERKVKKNLLIFVTPKILDANGQKH